jgi:ABC-type sugar transport system ATPase subunit
MATTDIIEAHRIAESFGTVRALDGVDLVVGEGSILGLLGPTAPARPRSSAS